MNDLIKDMYLSTREWLSRSQIQQRPMLAAYAGLLIFIVATIGVLSIFGLTSQGTDRLAVVSNFLSLGTLLLALVAGIIALAAYAAATGLPKLKLRIDLLGWPDKIWLQNDEGNPLLAIPSGQNIARLVIANSSPYAARSPSVTVEFEGVQIRADVYSSSPEWVPISYADGTKDVQALQWDGGPNYSIHGKSLRHLPDLNLQGLYIPQDQPLGGQIEPTISFRLLADGYSRRAIKVSVSYPGMEKIIKPWLVGYKMEQFEPFWQGKEWL